jgi:prolyl 4-hydroxylase
VSGLHAELEAVFRRDGQAAAVALVETRAARDDPAALELLGQWRLWGLYGARDLAAGRAAIARAAALGSEEAALTHAALLATGTGGPADATGARAIVVGLAVRSPLARRQSELLAAQPALPVPTPLRDDPYVARLDGFLSPAECAYLIERVGPRVRPSTVIDPRTRRAVPNPVRDSHGTNVPPPDEDLVIHLINRRIATATGTDWAQGEPLHLLRYQPGQQYRPHVDALPGVANQRILTVLLYLNDDYDGGETDFAGGLSVRGRAGDALVFANVRKDGSPDPRTRHAGTPVTRGVKWLATRWIRARPFDPWGG